MYDESGGTEKSRRDEARKLIKIIKGVDASELSAKVIDFVHIVESNLAKYGERSTITPKQLFWLRDIKDRSL